MSLLRNQDFVIHQLRTGYLQQINDGVGERLINFDTAFLNEPAFRDAGWSSNPPELKRCYSPPIPTSGTAAYFKAPNRSVRLGESFDDEEEEGGMVTGRPSNETVGPAVVARRRRRRATEEDDDDDDDSSDLSDESTEELEQVSARPTNSVKFAKMPERARSSSSPIRKTHAGGPSFMITSPSKPPENPDLDQASFGNLSPPPRVGRPRRDTTTSSEISSENDLDASLFRRKPISRRAAAYQAEDRIAEESHDERESSKGDQAQDDSDSDSLDSAYSEDLANPSLLGANNTSAARNLSSLPAPRSPAPNDPPRKSQPAPDVLPELPPPRPISTIQPISALSLALKAKNKAVSNPLDMFAELSASSDQSPFWIKMYLPFAKDPSKPMELALKRSKVGGLPIAVVEVIGFSLWRYTEDKIEPPLERASKNPNRWVLRNVEFGEVDYDFPALGRVRPMMDFTANNNRPPRARARDKPWDEFALVEADGEQLKENATLTPKFEDIVEEPETQLEEEDEASRNGRTTAVETAPKPEPANTAAQNPIIDPRHAFTSFRKDSIAPAQDLPQAPASHAVPRSGATKTLTIHYVNNSGEPQNLIINTTTDHYLSEIFREACDRLNLERGLFMLKVTGTNTIAPTDRMVEALGPRRSSLDLVARRFIGEGAFGTTGSPGSSSPNAPLLVISNDGNVHRRRPRRGTAGNHPLSQQTEIHGGSGMLSNLDSLGLGNFKRYNVVRKQPMSFTGNVPKVLAFDDHCLHIMPSDLVTGRERMFDAQTGKLTTIHFSNIVSCKVYRKHPKTFNFVVFRERESKKYDFDARSADEAQEIVREIKKGIEPYSTLPDRL